MIEELPLGWIQSDLVELSGINGMVSDGDWIESKNQDPNGDVRLLQLADIGVGYFRDRSARYITHQTAENLRCTLLQPDDLLIARMPEPIGRACRVPNLGYEAITVVDVMIWRKSHNLIDTSWLMHFINSPQFNKQVSSLAGGTTRQRISGSNLKKLSIPVPPLEEQVRIRETIDSVKEKSSRARELLNEVLLQTEIFRKKQSAAIFDKVSKPPKGSGGGIQRGATHKNEWPFKSLIEIADIQSGLALGKKRKPADVTTLRPYLRVANVQRGYLAISEIKYTDVTEQEFEKLKLCVGDVLMNEGGDRDKLGRGWVWNDEIPNCIHQNHVFRIRLKDPDFPSKWISYYANEFGQEFFFNEGQQTTNLASISKSKLSKFKIPIPPNSEAQNLVQRLDMLNIQVSSINSQVQESMTVLDQLDRSILALAYDGLLVQQLAGNNSAYSLIENLKKLPADLVSATPRIYVKPSKTKVIMNYTAVIDVLKSSEDWISAQDLFHACGNDINSGLDRIEPFYDELRKLDLSGLLIIETVRGERGEKLYDLIKLKTV